MSSPVSAAVANFYMEKLEQKALRTAPLNSKPRIWKRYIDDILEAIKKDQIAAFTDHLNAVDETGSIKFTYEEESNGTTPFLDLLLRHQPDGAVSTQVYRKPTHTDQYLYFRLHHPINHKTGVLRTLMDRKNTSVSAENDKNKEELHIRTALQNCGYPNLIFETVKQDQQNKELKARRPERQARRAHLTKETYH